MPMDNGITQSRSIAAGDVVLSCEPWIWSFQPKYQQILCAQCFTESSDLRTCSGCKLYRYCNSKCQTASWKKEHKQECVVLKTIQERLAKSPASMDHDCVLEGGTKSGCCIVQMLIAKLLNKITRAEMEGISGFAKKMTATEVLDMLPCDDRYPVSSSAWNIGQPADLAQCCSMFPNSRTGLPDLDLWTKKILYNAFPLLDQRGKSVLYGFGVFPQALYRKMTPVCWDMNVTMDFQGRMLVVRATEDITVFSGLKDLRQSELTPTFVDTLACRRERFQLIYGHACTCRKCSREYEAEITPLKCSTRGCRARIPSDERSLLPCPVCGAVNGDRLNMLQQFMEMLNKATGDDKNAMYGLIGQLDSANIVHPDAHARFVCGFGVAMVLADVGCHKDAWNLCREMVECVRALYPAYHLNRARHLVKAGATPYIWARDAGRKDQKRLKPVFDVALPKAMEWLKEAQSIYEKLGGEGSLWAREVAKFIAQYGGKGNGSVVDKAYWDWNAEAAVVKW